MTKGGIANDLKKRNGQAFFTVLLHCCSVLRCTLMQMASPFQIRFLEMKRIIKQLLGCLSRFLMIQSATISMDMKMQ